jgi:glycosyltransferase involved in cell wall biosynthesis
LEKAPLAGIGVLQVIPSLDSGGAERSTLEIAEALEAAGAKALVASTGGRLVGTLEASGGRFYRLPVRSKNPLTILANAFALARIVRREGVRIIHARSRAPAWSAFIAAKLTGAAFLTTYHGVYRARGLLKRWYNSVMVRGAVVIANSRYTARHVALAYPHARARIVTIPRGVDLRGFDPNAVSQARVDALRQAWGVGADTRILLVPGRVTAWKGQEIVIEALGALKRDGKAENLAAILIGDIQSKSLKTTLDARIRALGLDDIVRVAGHCADMPAAYKTASLVLQPSRAPEAFGRVAAEAEAMGAIVIASAIGAAPEVVRMGAEATGFLVKPGDVGALAGAIAQGLSLAPETRSAMVARAQHHIRANFTLEAMCARTLSVYAQILARAHAG